MILPTLTYLKTIANALKLTTFTLAPVDIYYILLEEPLNIYYKIVVGDDHTKANKEYLVATMFYFNKYVTASIARIEKNKALTDCYRAAKKSINPDIEQVCPIDDEHAHKYISSGLEIICEIIKLKATQYVTFNDKQIQIQTLEEPHNPWIFIDNMYVISALADAISANHNPQVVYKHTPMGLINMTALGNAMSVVSSYSNPDDVIILLHTLYRQITPLECFTIYRNQHTFPQYIYANFDESYNKLMYGADNPIKILVNELHKAILALNTLSNEMSYMDPKYINGSAQIAIDSVADVVKSKIQANDDIKKILVYLPLYYYLLSLKMLYV